jgi:cytochrome c peroxidase
VPDRGLSPFHFLSTKIQAQLRSSCVSLIVPSGHSQTTNKERNMNTTKWWDWFMVWCVLFLAGSSGAQTISSLKGVLIPTPPNLGTYVTNIAAAKALGKALFWDTNVSSDRRQACASCHFHAGADNRAKNQLDPGILHQTAALKNVFNPTRSGNAGGPNYTVRKADFPFHVLSNPLLRDSTVLFDTDDIMSSQGVHSTTFQFGAPSLLFTGEPCAVVADPVFKVGGINTRRVEPRNSPTTINAIFNFRNFWDGRANNRFNGSSPFGDRDLSAGIYTLNASNQYQKIPVSIPNASAASQAVGPPPNSFEMSCGNGGWLKVAAYLINNQNNVSVRALASANVSTTDSLLGSYTTLTQNGVTVTLSNGLNTTYPDMIRAAFSSVYWRGGDSSGPQVLFNINGSNYTQMQLNFSFFFGLAIQLYESTLVSDESPIDSFFASPSIALTAQEERGRIIFGTKAAPIGTLPEQGKGKCINCHFGPQLTNAGTPSYNDAGQGKLISKMIMGDGNVGHYDEGFYNIGVRPTIEDLGVGFRDGFGNPLSFTRQLKRKLGSPSIPFVDQFTVCTSTVPSEHCPSTSAVGFRTAVDGAFKVPTLRNVELTGPYFHNGSRKTLEEVVEFYNRGGDRRGPNGNDTTGFNNTLEGEPNLSNLDADIQPLGLTPTEQADLVAFLKRPLTDDRVRCDKAPFDHPALQLHPGHIGNNVSVQNSQWTSGLAEDEYLQLPAVGAAGMCGANLSGARLPFDQTLAP